MKFHGACHEACNTDIDCLGVNKCCYNGCGHECMKPINSSRCVYKNRTYNVGERMFKDDCTTCLCQGEGMTSDPSGFDCFTITCAVWRCPDGMVMKTTPGQCCGQCEGIKGYFLKSKFRVIQCNKFMLYKHLTCFILHHIHNSY